MKYLLFICVSLFFMVGCGDLKETNKTFSSFDDKFEFCSNYIDDVSCVDVRALVILYNDTFMRSRGVNAKICSLDDMINTDTCKNYYYTSEYKKDIINLVKNCEDDGSIEYCGYFIDIQKMIEIIRL